MYEMLEGYILCVLMFDKDCICSVDGKEIIEDNIVIFIWNNLNGFSCIVVFSNNLNEECLLLMFSFCDFNLMVEGMLEYVISNDIINRIILVKEYCEDIVKYICVFDV